MLLLSNDYKNTTGILTFFVQPLYPSLWYLEAFIFHSTVHAQNNPNMGPPLDTVFGLKKAVIMFEQRETSPMNGT
jgi:hypothetical protein